MIVRRLMYKLGCRNLALVGCVRSSLLTSLAELISGGWDEPHYTGYARALLPNTTWGQLDDVEEGVYGLEDPVVLLSSSVVSVLGDDRLLALAARAPLLVIDAGDEAAAGPPALAELIETVRSRGLQVDHAEMIAPLGDETSRRTSPAVLAGDGHDSRAGYLAAAGFHGLRLDPMTDEATEPIVTTRVCIVSYEIVGPSRNGGIGTANTSLAFALARAGQDVTLIYSGAARPDADHERWVQHFGASGIRYEQLSDAVAERVDSPFSNLRRAWAVYEMLLSLHQEQPFDVIHGPECQGHLGFVALAKHHGLAFDRAQIVLGVHSPSRWCAEANRQPFGFPSWLADESLERASVESADVVISPSGYMLSYLSERGWRLPERTFVQQYIQSEAVRRSIRVPRAREKPIDEIVFFGRLEKRKGLEAFCDALDLLTEEVAARIAITFLGSVPSLPGPPAPDYITRRAEGWPWSAKVITDASQHEAVHYLSSRRCLAVMPSLVDNSPNTVYEVLALGLPFIASRSGGTGELIAVEDLERCTFAGWREEESHLEPVPDDVAPSRFDTEALVNSLRRALSDGVGSLRPAIDPDLNEQCHVRWHRALTVRKLPAQEKNRRLRLSMIQVRGSEPAAHAVIRRPDVAVTMQDPGHPGSTRRDPWVAWIEDQRITIAQAFNAAAREAEGDLLVFLPASVRADATLVPTLERVAIRSSADVFLFAVTSPASGRRPERLSVPVPGPAVLGLLFPIFHAHGLAIRPDAFRELGGFSDGDSSNDPATFLLTRALVEGHRVEVVPAILGARYPSDPDGLADGGPWFAGFEQQLELLRPFAAAGGAAIRELPALFRATTQSGNSVQLDSGESFRDGLRLLGLRELQRVRQRGRDSRLLSRWLEPR